MKQNYWFSSGLVLTLVVLLAGCSLAPAASTPIPVEPTAPVQLPDPTPKLPVAPDPTPVPSVAPDPTAPPEPTSVELTYVRVEVPEVGISFEVPADWARQEPDWTWIGGSPVSRVGFRWAVVQPPAEVQAVMLPSPSQMLDAQPFELSWGSGYSYLLETYDPSSTDAQVATVENHLIVVISVGGSRYAYDLYAVGTTAEELQAVQPVLQHMVESAVRTAP